MISKREYRAARAAERRWARSDAPDITAPLKRFRSEMVDVYASAPADELHTPPVQLARRLMHQADEAIRELAFIRPLSPDVQRAADRFVAAVEAWPTCPDCGSVDTFEDEKESVETGETVRTVECAECHYFWPKEEQS